MGELDAIVQRMIEAGESEANIATVIQGYQPPPLGSVSRDRQYLADSADVTAGDAARSLPGIGATVAGGMALAGAGRLLTKIPVKPLAKAGVAAVTSGPRITAAKEAFRAAQAAVPKAAPSIPAPVQAAAGPKPKLKANEVAGMLRQQHGSAKAGQMLYGPARPGVKAADRAAAIKRLAPGESQLPARAKAAMERELAASTPEEAFAYAAKAPNDLAKEHFGDLLRRIIVERSGR